MLTGHLAISSRTSPSPAPLPSSLFPFCLYLFLKALPIILYFGEAIFQHIREGSSTHFPPHLQKDEDYGGKRRQLPWLQLGTRKPESSSLPKDQSQGGQQQQSWSRWLIEQSTEVPQVPLLVGGVSFLSDPINTFSWRSLYGCWDKRLYSISKLSLSVMQQQLI